MANPQKRASSAPQCCAHKMPCRKSGEGDCPWTRRNSPHPYSHGATCQANVSLKRLPPETRANRCPFPPRRRKSKDLPAAAGLCSPGCTYGNHTTVRHYDLPECKVQEKPSNSNNRKRTNSLSQQTHGHILRSAIVSMPRNC